MYNKNALIDNSVANRIVELDCSNILRLDSKIISTSTYKQDKKYLTKILEELVPKGILHLKWNLSVKMEIENTGLDWKKRDMFSLLEDLDSTYYQSTVFPIVFPATFLKPEEKEILNQIYRCLPKKYTKGEKFIADVLFNDDIEFLLTTDRKHLATPRMINIINKLNLNNQLKIRLPQELYEELTS